MTNQFRVAEAALLVKLEIYLDAIAEPFDSLHHCVSLDQVDIDILQNAYHYTDELPDLLEKEVVRAHLRGSLNVFLQHWPKIKRWLIQLVNCLSSHDDIMQQITGLSHVGAFSSPQAVSCRVLNSLLVASDIPKLQNLVANDAEIVDFLFTVHQRQGEHYGLVSTHEECQAWKDHFTMYPLMALGTIMNRKSSARISGEIDWDERKFMSVANIILNTARNATVVSRLYSNGHFIVPEAALSSSTKLMLDLLSMKASVAQKLLWSALPVSAGVLRYIVDTILEHHRFEMEHLSLLEDISRFAVEPFVTLFEREKPTVRQLRKLVRMGFLDLCADMCVLELKIPQLGWMPLPSKDLLTRVHGAFTSFMCHYDVARFACKSLDQLQPVQLEAALSHTGMSQSWSTCVEYAIRKELFNVRRQLKRRCCDNCQVVMNRTKSLKVCAGCKARRYCSTECQKTDWIDGDHRATCETLKKQKSYSKHLDFLAYIAFSDVQHSLPGIHATAQRQHTGTALSRLITIADYTPQKCPSFYKFTLGQGYRYKHAPTLSVARLSRTDKSLREHLTTCQKRGLHLVQALFQIGDRHVRMFIGMNPKPPKRPEPSKELAVQGSRRVRSGIQRSPRFASGDRDKPTLEAVEWDEVDEVWSRAVASESPFMEAVKIEARRYATENITVDGEDVTILGCEVKTSGTATSSS